MWKKIFACFLCCLLVAIPLVQRSYAAVTTITVVTILILTILTAMGITLVLAEGTKEAYIADKGDSFMSSKGYTGSFADWISGGTPMDISLKLGTLMVAKAVVDRIKEFVNWLVPGAEANSVVDLGSGAVTSTLYSTVICDGNFSTNGRFYPTSVKVFPANQSITNGEVTILKDASGAIQGTNRYNSVTGSLLTVNYTIRPGNPFYLLRITDSFTYNNNVRLPGVYLGSGYGSTPTSMIVDTDYFYFRLSDVDVESVPDGQAIIGDYDDLSDLTTTTTEGTGGTTIINNTFYITQDAQALNPSGQSLDDIIDALRQALESDKREVTVTGTTAATVAAGEAAPNYSDFQLGNLDLSGLGALLTTRFPFSIPWDLVRIFQVFVADPEAPHWSVNLLPIAAFDGVDTTLDLDLGDYPIIGQVSRWFCIIDLCLGLVFATKKLIWTA